MKVEISVVMAVFNAERYLREAIVSILNQTIENFELVVVNDGSTDNSRKIIESINDNRIIAINQENAGVAKASNIGVEQSNGYLIARLDSDDISLPNRLEKQYYFLKNNNEYIAVGSSAEIIDSEDNYLYTSIKKQTNDDLKNDLPKSPFINSSVMFRKETFFKAGKYCENLPIGEDKVLFNRMAKFGKFYNFIEPLIKYRMSPYSISLRKNIGSRISEIHRNAINKNRLSDVDIQYLNSIYINNRSSSDRLANYHLHLAKKYLWSNYNPENARKNLKKSIEMKPQILSYILFLISFLSENKVKCFYKNIQIKKALKNIL